jgi:hypothetical protein
MGRPQEGKAPRPEAVRGLVELGLAAGSKPKKARS